MFDLGHLVAMWDLVPSWLHQGNISSTHLMISSRTETQSSVDLSLLHSPVDEDGQNGGNEIPVVMTTCTMEGDDSHLKFIQAVVNAEQASCTRSVAHLPPASVTGTHDYLPSPVKSELDHLVSYFLKSTAASQLPTDFRLHQAMSTDSAKHLIQHPEGLTVISVHSDG